MIVSHNELISMVTKAFMGLKRSCGEADLIANMVADLQMIGLNGVKHFNLAVSHIIDEDDLPISPVKVIEDHVFVDLRNTSLACHLPVIIDYALESMIKHKQLTIEIERCHNRWLAFGELVKLAAKGISCYVEWHNHTSHQRYLCILNKGNTIPELFAMDSVETEEKYQKNIVIKLSIRNFNIEKSSLGFEQHISAESLYEAQRTMWKSGIEVDDQEWMNLKQLASAILVENSELSKLGAGS